MKCFIISKVEVFAEFNDETKQTHFFILSSSREETSINIKWQQSINKNHQRTINNQKESIKRTKLKNKKKKKIRNLQNFFNKRIFMKKKKQRKKE